VNGFHRACLACLSVLVLVAVPAIAAPPVTVTLATPASAYQGTIALDVVVSGNGFDPTAKVQYFVTGTANPGGITVKRVTFRSSKELVTTIDVADTADLANFDIQVTLDSGRKGKGTSLFSVKVKPNDEPLPTYPPARVMQSFTSNGGTTAATSRLYMFGGDGREVDVHSRRQHRQRDGAELEKGGWLVLRRWSMCSVGRNVDQDVQGYLDLQ
jgi:hypothetical protein